MLITSRETQRWVLPKGNPIKGLRAHEAAAQEAFEEAGVEGIACPAQIGSYTYVKRRKSGLTRNVAVDVFPFSVTGQAEEWPEQDERTTAWFTLANAAAAVDEPELKSLIASFREPTPSQWLVDRVPAMREKIGRKFPLLRWFQSLMPRQGHFFDLFEAHSQTLVAGADALARLMQGGPDMETHIREIVSQEHQADTIARDVLLAVRRTFITPFDRGDIRDLIASMDDAIDQMQKTAKAITLFEVSEFQPHMRELAAIIVQAADLTAEAIPLLRSLRATPPRLNAIAEEVTRIEGHADELYDAGMKALFRSAARTADGLHRRREIYDHLEKVVDRFEDVANGISGILIEHL